jgi:hypothetical protein
MLKLCRVVLVQAVSTLQEWVVFQICHAKDPVSSRFFYMLVFVPLKGLLDQATPAAWLV